ncbi:MAG TPA: hypothetical protein VF525_09090 [Pyrinomonadaceae bacterium]|jgi:hypothetical protein
MDDEQIKEVLRRAAELSTSVPDTLREVAFSHLLDVFLNTSAIPDKDGGKSTAKESKSETDQHSTARQARRGKAGSKSKESYSIDRNLNLRGGDTVPSFTAFVEEKKPKSHQHFNTVAVYYLQELLGLDKVNLNQVYTCYREAGRRPPEHFRQSFIDTKNKLGYLDINEESELSIPHRGRMFVEHDLPGAEGTKKGS